MEEELLVLNMAILLLLGGFCSIVFKRFKMPAVIGYLVSGIIIAAVGWASEETVEIVEFLSDIGLALMMFCIGMELNLTKLRRMGSFAILVVMIQVPIILVGGIVLGGMLLGLDSLQALIFGAIISGSSTAVVTIVLADQKNMSHSDVESLILVTVVEDVFQVLILSAISPLMSGSSMDLDGIIWMFVLIIAFMITAIVVGIALLPKFFDWLHKKMPAEVQVIIGLGICFGLAYLSIMIGMSMAIGAFLAGVIVSQSKNASKEIEDHVSPMKDVFMMMFFISIGMQISVEGLANNIIPILIIYLIYFLLKFGSVVLAFFVGNKPMALAYHSSIALVAMGEFAFIISKEALGANIISNDFYTAVIGAALVSMIALPVINTQNQKVIGAFAFKSPRFIQRAYHAMDVKRGVIYDRISSISKSTQNKFKTGLATVYVNVIIIAIIEVVFIMTNSDITEYVNAHTPDELSMYASSIVVLLLNFIVLIPSLYFIVRYMTFIQRIMLDAERRAIRSGEKQGYSLGVKIMRFFVRRNNWLLVILFDFIILLITPNNVDFLGHMIVLVAGAAVIVISLLYAYIRRS
ncbi:MAG: cation:proton antiporter [Thermoplasmata archaeon]|nr:cation:proton antiporter [Thermoplasmata archaeon]